MTKQEFENGVRVLEAAQRGNLIASISEGRRLLGQGAILLNNEKIADPNKTLTAEDFADGYVLIKKGKTNV